MEGCEGSLAGCRRVIGADMWLRGVGGGCGVSAFGCIGDPPRGTFELLNYFFFFFSR